MDILMELAPGLGIDPRNLTQSSSFMDDDISMPDTPAEATEMSSYERQKASLQTYLDSLPYECETIEEMQARLEEIVGKIFVCAKAQNWLLLTTWDGMLQCWLLMRYPMPTTTRAKLVRLYYELCILPGVEPRVIRSWADMLSRLLANKPGQSRKLEINDLQLPWQPLWRVLQKELWPKDRIQEPSRNVVNILLYLAEQCQAYYPASEIPDMLDTFIPLATKETILTMIPVLTSFLPPTHTHLYLPAFFKLWEAFNSSVIDDRFIDLAGNLSEEHVSGPEGDAGQEGGAQWKDVGIWSDAEWNLLIGKGLGSMNVPVGATRGASTTGGHADSLSDRRSLKIKKIINRFQSLAKIIVYSMSVDGPIRDSASSTPGRSTGGIPSQTGYVAGSKALDSLDRLITSTESFFHPSNAGPWSQYLTTFLQHLANEFSKRMKEEERHTCKTPITRRLTPTIRRAFVNILRTPALLSMFSKDAVSMGFALGAIRSIAILEPTLIMPELLERAYGGLEVVNETHRTTAVLSLLLGISRPLVTEKIWLGGQKHLVPLLELCLPGIDLNDPGKTICATMFIVGVMQHVKVGDLSMHQSGMPLTEDTPGDELMDVDDTHFPEGTDGDMPALSREDERAFVRDSTAGFADWITTLFRRVLALYENLPEEGGKRNTTGGKQEETVLKSIKSMMDVVCLHLSDQLFDLVLRLVFDYATTNAKSNAVKAFGQLIACLARVKPEQTMAKFLPFCIAQIEEELKHGASSVRTTSAHAAIPSDTTLHWNLAILRGCLGYGGAALLKYRQQILDLLALLIDKTKGERGYSGTGRLITRILHTLAGVYPLNSRFVNTDEWEDPAFDKDHNVHWGKLLEPQDVVVEWHVPSSEEIDFVLELLDKIASPTMDKVDALLERTARWDSADGNDFCRYLVACRSVWGGLSAFIQEQTKEVANPCLNVEVESPELLVSHLQIKAGFILTDPNDRRYQRVAAHRNRFGNLSKRAAAVLRQSTGDEDHIDAVIGVAKSIDVYLLDYGLNKTTFDSLQKNYTQARDLNRTWNRQKENSRMVFVKRAQVYHSGRVYMHALYRRRSALDDELLSELVELSLSPYTRVRRHAQAVLRNAYGYFVRSTRFTLPSLFDALKKGADPDRMKGALYVLWDKGIASYALADQSFHSRYLLSLLECQHEEKPSVQKLVGNLSQDCLTHLHEEAIHTDAYALESPRVEQALRELETEFSSTFIDQKLLAEAIKKTSVRVAKRRVIYDETMASILEVALRPQTHWRYVQMASRFLYGLLRRDVPVSPDVTNFLLENTTSPQPTIRITSQRAITKLLAFVKVRTFAKSGEELWLDEWKNPLRATVDIKDPLLFLEALNRPIDTEEAIYIDKLRTGFLSWTTSVSGSRPVRGLRTAIAWESDSQPSLAVIRKIVTEDEYFDKLAVLWSQESSKNGGAVDLRLENVLYIKSLAKMLEQSDLDALLSVVEPLLSDPDKFKQRAGGEFFAGLLRGAKHWPKDQSDKLWTWAGSRLRPIFAQIKPDTLPFWETVFTYLLENRDPRRSQTIVDWILSLSLEFQGDSAFDMSKSLSMFEVLLDSAPRLFDKTSDQYVDLLFDNANTNYAEIRLHIVQVLSDLIGNQWQPWYTSTGAFLRACQESNDPLRIREPVYGDRITKILNKLPKWKEERLPPPKVSQSEYDKVGLTVLLWLWLMAHGIKAPLLFPYVIPMMPEIFRMTELNDNSELQAYSSAVLYVLSAVTPPAEFIEVILDNFVTAIKNSTSWRLRLHAFPTLVVFFYRNLLAVSPSGVSKVMDVLLDCLADENVEVREMASKVLSGVLRCSQRQSIVPLKNRFVSLARKTVLPPRKDATYAEKLRSLHSAILGICSLIESFPYSVEPWMPPLTEVLAPHATDPPPISTTIRKCASEFKKTHQDTWHKDQLMFDEDQIQSLSTMLVGTSYYA